MGKKVDLTGRCFGRLTALRPTDALKHGKVVWECQCDCGALHYATTSHLTSGNVQSCGCLGLETRLNNLDKINHQKDSVNGTRLSMLDAKLSSDNSSGYKGVRWNKTAKKWESYIYFKGEKIHLGLHDKKYDAITARKEAEEKYYKPILDEFDKRLKEHGKTLKKDQNKKA